MSNVYWKEFKGWLKSFTNTEKALSLLLFVLLVVFLVLLVFVIVHLSICPEKLETEEFNKSTEGTTSTISDDTFETDGQSSRTSPCIVTPENGTDVDTAATVSDVTIGPSDMCSWSPSQQTATVTRYFEDSSEGAGATPPLEWLAAADGDEVGGELARYTLALVKLRPPADVTFGCIATVVARWWALTAASCLEAIEELEALDSFVLRAAWGGAAAASGVTDVRVHPRYRGADRARDAAALRAATPLLPPAAAAVPRASLLDYFLVTIGERFTILGYGKFRTVDPSAAGRSLRRTSVYVVPAAQCPPAHEAAAVRHLAPGRAAPHGYCGAAPLCAGVAAARDQPCNYCAGTPLYRRGVLYGIMSDNQQCGAACDPALFVNVAVIQDWLDDLVRE